MDEKVLIELVETEMPYGKYKGLKLYKLPEPYLAWYKAKGFPRGKIGMLLESLYEIKLNGLEYLLENLAKMK